jgi:hypothetical protein
LNLVYKNSEAEWASPPLTLPKPGPDQYRMTVDLRLPNASKVPAAWPMHSLQHDLRDLHGSFFFKCWILSTLLQIPLPKDSQDRQTFITPDGVYTLTRVQLGTRNATQNLRHDGRHQEQHQIMVVDCPLHTKTESDLLAALKFFSSNVRSIN